MKLETLLLEPARSVLLQLTIFALDLFLVSQTFVAPLCDVPPLF